LPAIRSTRVPASQTPERSLADRADGFDLLHADPRGPRVSTPDERFAEGWEAGCDECFPAVGAGAYPGDTHHRITLPDHGELWSCPAEVASHTDHSIAFTQHGRSLDYQFRRTLTLVGPALRFDYTLINPTDSPLLSAWAQHALFNATQPVELDLPALRMRLNLDVSGPMTRRTFDWPGPLDFARPACLPADGGWKLASIDPIRGPGRLRFPLRGRSLSIDNIGSSDPTNPTAYWGIWLNTGAYKGIRQVALEVTHTRHDALAEAVADGAYLTTPPHGQSRWAVEWRIESGATV
jgi:hypothetical protein